jgi:hypothetical protein
MSSYCIYPEMLETIQIYIQKLNEADALIIELDHPDLRPGLERIPVLMDEVVIGHLADEIGGVWSFSINVVD